MVIIHNDKESGSIHLLESEKEQLKTELATIQRVGGAVFDVPFFKMPVNHINIYNERIERVGMIVGNSAILIYEILSLSEDDASMSSPVRIESFIAKYL